MTKTRQDFRARGVCSLTILAVDNDEKRLKNLMKLLCETFPDDHVEGTCDPLMAGKYGYNNRVDLMLTALVMRPMDGDRMAAFMRRKIPDIKVVLMAYESEFEDYICDYDNYTVLRFPASKEKLKKAVGQV